MRNKSVFNHSRREALRSMGAVGLCMGSTALTACSSGSSSSSIDAGAEDMQMTSDEADAIDSSESMELPEESVDAPLESPSNDSTQEPVQEPMQEPMQEVEEPEPGQDVEEDPSEELTDTPTTFYGPLQEPDINGIRLPVGFTSRIVATTGQKPIESSDYVWHGAPDGGAVFETNDGWIYLSNAELHSQRGGVGALRFDRDANLVSAYPVLTGSSRNCAGGAMPWGTWLSCEEVSFGQVWECYPEGQPAKLLPALGLFKHEAVCADPARGHLYLTEDEPDGCLYRFTPSGSFEDLSEGKLQFLRVLDGEVGAIEWIDVEDPSASNTETRYQTQFSTAFNGGEGICLQNDKVFFATKGDGRVWEIDIVSQSLRIFYDDDNYEYEILNGLDGITGKPATDDILVAEDGGDMQVVSLSNDGRVTPVLQIPGQLNSEITGVAFDPSGTRLYFSSQRGFDVDGITYEITGPFPQRT